MRVLIDYRSALRQRSGVGEYTHELVKALAALSQSSGPRLDLTVFSSSWKDRLDLGGRDFAGVTRIDRRVPVRLLNFAWHRLGWPPAEAITGRSFDVTHSMHPLILPARAAAHVVTIHDLHFLAHPERTRGEIRRDYPSLARSHAQRADGVVAVSRFTASEIERHLGVPAERISICSPGAPDWTPREGPAPGYGHVLFFGTLEPRKNLGALIDAYERLMQRRPMPRLFIGGSATREAKPWLERIAQPWTGGNLVYLGYIDPAKRRDLYVDARVLVQPSFEEGFGMPVLEAMTMGVPVVAANRGALPEVLGDAGLLFNPEDPDALASALERMIDDDAFAAACAAKGRLRARIFSWEATGRQTCEAYRLAIERRRCASA